MQKKRITLVIPLVIFNVLTAFPLFAENAETITQKHYKAMLKDLQSYIRENPQAADIEEAKAQAVDAAYFADEPELFLTLLHEQFETLKAQNPIPAQELAQTGMAVVQFSLEQGKPEIAQSVRDSFQTLAETEDNEMYVQVLEMLNAQVNKPAVGTHPELKGTTVDGEEIALSDFKGKVVMIDFWATWCGPCIAEMPNVKAVYEKYHDKGFDIIGVSLDRSVEPLNEYIEENHIPWPNIFDADQSSSLADQFAITSIPSIFIVDKEGKIAAVNARGPELEKEVAKLLSE